MSDDALWALINVAVAVAVAMMVAYVIVYRIATKPFRQKGDSRPRGGAQSDV